MRHIMHKGLVASPSVLEAQPVMTVCLLMNLLVDVLIQSTQQLQRNEVQPGYTVFSDHSRGALQL